MRPTGSPEELEKRRLKALKYLSSGLTPVEVARKVGVDRRSVRRWKSAVRANGRKAIAAKPAGRPPLLNAEQKKKLVQYVLQGPEAFGFRTSLWTCRRVLSLIQDKFHVTYHRDHVGRLLHSCGLTPQRPQKLALERDERRIKTWVRQEWPAIKKNSSNAAHA
jgi:transposase